MSPSCAGKSPSSVLQSARAYQRRAVLTALGVGVGGDCRWGATGRRNAAPRKL